MHQPGYLFLALIIFGSCIWLLKIARKDNEPLWVNLVWIFCLFLVAVYFLSSSFDFPNHPHTRTTTLENLAINAVWPCLLISWIAKKINR